MTKIYFPKGRFFANKCYAFECRADGKKRFLYYFPSCFQFELKKECVCAIRVAKGKEEEEEGSQASKIVFGEPPAMQIHTYMIMRGMLT